MQVGNNKTKGLQKGHSGAMDSMAKTIDSSLRDIRNELYEEFRNIEGITMKKKVFYGASKTPCQPDGGAWYYNGALLAVFEAKKQANKGNAIERWYKNAYICKKINKQVSYVTFCCGEGATTDGVMAKILDVAHDGIFNIYRGGDNSCYLSKEGFAKEYLKHTMREIIHERIQHEKSK